MPVLSSFARIAAGLGCALAIAHPASAFAQAWPQKPITMVVSNGAGSAPDVTARLLASRMEPVLGQPIIIEDKPGGSNVIGAVNVARAPADGYRLFFATSSALSANPFLTKNLPYDPLKDFRAIGFVAASHNYLLVNKDTPVHSLAEFIAADKKAPGSLSLGIDGPRNLAGVTGRVLNYRAGTQFVLVSYPNIVNGVQELMAGRVQAGIFPVAITQAGVDSGALRPIAVTAAKRVRAYPEVPAVSETFPNFDFSGWFMIMAPAGTPDDVINKTNAALGVALRDPEVIAMAPKLGYEYWEGGVGTPGMADAYLRHQIEYWRSVTSDLKIDPE